MTVASFTRSTSPGGAPSKDAGQSGRALSRSGDADEASRVGPWGAARWAFPSIVASSRASSAAAAAAARDVPLCGRGLWVSNQSRHAHSIAFSHLHIISHSRLKDVNKKATAR